MKQLIVEKQNQMFLNVEIDFSKRIQLNKLLFLELSIIKKRKK